VEGGAMIKNEKGDTQMDATNVIEASPADDREWSLVTVTHKGTVSILRNLDTYTAREAYKRLRPDKRPEKIIWPACGGLSWSGGYSHSINENAIAKVEIIGPAGQDLDPWFGVAPRIVDLAAMHERDVAAGRAQCDICDDPVKREAAKEDRRRKELLKAVPLAFWLEDSNAC